MGRPDNQFTIQFEISESLFPSINRDLLVNKVLDAIEKELTVSVEFWERKGLKLEIRGLVPAVKIQRCFIPFTTEMNIYPQPITKEEAVRYYKCEP